MRISRAAAGALFSEECGHIPVSMRKLEDARILWINPEAYKYDEHAGGQGNSNHSEYGDHLLEQCAYAIASPGAGSVRGFADRYGGSGIGQNGGSGRAVILNGYSLKGVGATPLVSALAAPSHASGGAYLEESVRETIYSEIVRRHFPHSAVPTLAIIDTGRMQYWGNVHGPSAERMVTVVRPAFLRPAHFMRAVGFYSGHPKEGARDSARVRAMFKKTKELLGSKQTDELFVKFGQRWATQLGYGLARRISHGSNTPSNVALDGSLVDFGASCHLPGYSTTATTYLFQNRKSIVAAVSRTIRELSYYLEAYGEMPCIASDRLEEYIGRAEREFQRALTVEMLRACGLDEQVVEAISQSPDYEGIEKSIEDLLGIYERRTVCLVLDHESNVMESDLFRLWSGNPPNHLRALQSRLSPFLSSSDADCARHTVRIRGRYVKALFKDELRKELFEDLAPLNQPSESGNSALVSASIDKFVGRGAAYLG